MTGPIHAAAGRVYQGWPAAESSDGLGYTIDVTGSDSSWTAVAITDDAGLVFCIYSYSPFDVPAEDAEALARMSEFADRVNHGLVAGTFELDRDTGEVRVRSGYELGTLPPALTQDPDFLETVVRDLSAANVGLMDRYVTGLAAVLLGHVPVVDIIRDIEATDSLTT